MRASFQWIRSLAPGLSCTAEELAARFTSAGLEVEAVSRYGEGAESCVVARVVSVRPHPSRSGLRLVTVERGGGTQEVVCGAPNVPDPGGLVVLAPLGAHLPAKGLTIAPRAIGGVTSEGMLCSEAELGLTEDSSGILVLPEGLAEPGTSFVKAVPEANDTLFEIGLTPNRPDGLGHIGLAREAAALFGVPWAPPAVSPLARDDAGKAAVSALVEVVIEDAERCPHYGAAAVLDVAIGPSPLAVRYRLSALGVRAISNAVDVTNLVMLEQGHPMHAFDLDRVAGRRIVVRRARAGEKLTTLDGVERTLVEDDLVIADGKGAVALAGVMGGAESEIGPSTRRVLLECAYFDPRGVRRTGRRHALHTESSHRFERGVDHGDTPRSLARAAELTRSLAGGSVVPGLLLVEPRTLEAPRVRLRYARMNKLLGVDVPVDEARAILGRLGFVEVASSSEAVEVQAPTHRPDISREADLVEEVVRVRGIESIPTVLPQLRPQRMQGEREETLRRARGAAVELGLSEALLFGFVSRTSLAALSAPEPTVVLKNPLSEEQAVMRTSLLPGLAEAVARAARHGERDVRLFGIGALFLPGADPAGLPEERLAFAALVAGDRPAHLHKPEPVDVWDAKGIALGFVRRMVRREAEVMLCDPASRPAHLHPRGAAIVCVEGREVGRLGPLHPDVVERLDLPPGVLAVEIDLAALATIPVRTPRYEPLPRFPAASRDLAVVVSDRVAAGEVGRAVREAAGDLAEHVEIFDRFAGGAIPEGHASLAFHVVYRAKDRTLTDAEVDTRHAEVVAAVKARFGATLRA